MTKTLLLECAGGISGDMSVAALLDLGADEEVLKKALKTLPSNEFFIEITKVKKAGVVCTDFNVICAQEQDGHDHDMEYLHGHEHAHEHNHDHGHEHEHEHNHSHDHHHHMHRNLSDVYAIIDKAEITENARNLAKKIFLIIAEAEAKAHGESLEAVHFHEVGAIDSIVDIVAFAVCYDNLGITDTVNAGISEGSGTVRCQHGILPIPVPAVTNIAANNGLILNSAGIKGELVTPTGAAIAAAIITSNTLPKKYKILATGLGAGKRNYEIPSILRAMIIESVSDSEDCIYRLETDIDDCTGEALGYVMERLYEAGAREVHYAPIFMKKNRPAYELIIIANSDKIEDMEKIVFSETTTIGIRRMRMERTVAGRRIETVNTRYGQSRIKICEKAGAVFAYPEYEDVANLAKQSGVPFLKMYDIIKNAFPNN